MGEEGYAELVLRCEAHLDTVKRARSAGARQLIPLLVHPATVAAGTVGGRRTRVPRKRTAAPAAGANEPAHPVSPSKADPCEPRSSADQVVGLEGAASPKAPAKSGAKPHPAKPAKAPGKPSAQGVEGPPLVVIRSPNIWDTPDVYELENLASDRAGVIDTTIDALHPLAGADLLDLGCGTGFHLPRLAARGARVVGVEPHLPLVAPRPGPARRCRAAGIRGGRRG